MRCKSGFGILEVLVAAVVLGFLIVGLTQLQKGNREAVLRIRARDAAQAVATDAIDSLRRMGLSSVNITTTPVQFEKERVFEGATGQSKINYRVKMSVGKGEESTEQSALTRAKEASGGSANPYTNELAHDNTKKVEVSVEWDFKKSVQSIQLSEVIK